MTEKQAQFLNSLCQKHSVQFNPELSVQEASNMISELLSKTQKQYSGQTLTDGMYLFNGSIVKVQKAVHGSGNLYAKELINGKFEYVKGLVNKLTLANKMTIEQAKEYGKLYGVCCCCGAVLTDEVSIQNGIGPVCAGKYF